MEPNTKILTSLGNSRAAKRLVVGHFEAAWSGLEEAASEAESHVERNCKSQLLHLDLVVCVLTELWMRATEPDANDLLWGGASGDGKRESMMVQSFLGNSVNSLLAVRRCALSGLHLQAKVLFRSYVELADIFICVIGDKAFCEKYKAWPGTLDATATNYWKAHLSPARVRMAMGEVLARSGLSAVMVEEFLKARRDTYSWLSAYSHAHPTANFLGAYDHVPATRTVRASLGGRGGTWLKVTLRNMAEYNAEFLLLLLKLIEGHGWAPPDSKSDRRVAWDVMQLHWALLHSLTRKAVRFRSRVFESPITQVPAGP